jgi:hypothetical protein
MRKIRKMEMPLARIFIVLILCCITRGPRTTENRPNRQCGLSGKPVPLNWFVFAHYSRANCLRFSKHVHVFQLSIVLLLAGDIEVNPGPVNFGFGNCRSIRNKGPAISDLITSADIDIFGITETHIRENDTPSFLNDLTPDGYTLLNIPRLGKTGGGVGFLIKKCSMDRC